MASVVSSLIAVKELIVNRGPFFVETRVLKRAVQVFDGKHIVSKQTEAGRNVSLAIFYLDHTVHYSGAVAFRLCEELYHVSHVTLLAAFVRVMRTDRRSVLHKIAKDTNTIFEKLRFYVVTDGDFLDKGARRSSLVKNAKGYNRFGREQYLDRGDFNSVVSPSRIRRERSVSVRQTDWIPHTEFPACNHRPSRARRNKDKRSIFFKKDTTRLSCSEGTFRVYNIYGDGNCMFRAISYILWRNEDEHRYLRSMVVQHIRENWHEYGPFVMAEWNISDREAYCDYMSMVGTFASELECTVATKMYNMNLSIYREENDSHELKMVFHNHVNSQYETARLLFTGISDSGHYNVLLLDD